MILLDYDGTVMPQASVDKTPSKEASPHALLSANCSPKYPSPFKKDRLRHEIKQTTSRWRRRPRRLQRQLWIFRFRFLIAIPQFLRIYIDTSCFIFYLYFSKRKVKR